MQRSTPSVLRRLAPMAMALVALAPGASRRTVLPAVSTAELARTAADPASGGPAATGPAKGSAESAAGASSTTASETDAVDVTSAGARTVAALDVCPASGYLCDKIPDGGSYRVAHFGPTVHELRIDVPVPDAVPGARADSLRNAAIQGIEDWNGHPLPVRIVDSADSADVVVRWKPQLTEGGLGETRSRFDRTHGVARYVVDRLELATRNPYNGQLLLTPGSVELTAAHEMGHVLGLPHSDSPSDLMYPTDAAKHLSERDFQTVAALYRIPSGTRIQK